MFLTPKQLLMRNRSEDLKVEVKGLIDAALRDAVVNENLKIALNPWDGM